MLFRSSPLRELQEATGGQLADVVIDVSGSPRALPEAVSLVRKGGTIVAASVVGQETLVPMPTDQLLFKQVTIRFVYTSTEPAL